MKRLLLLAVLISASAIVAPSAKFVAWEVGDGPSGILKKDEQEANYSRAFFYGPGMYLYVNRPTHLGVIVLRNCDNCPVDAGSVAARALEQLAMAKAKKN